VLSYVFSDGLQPLPGRKRGRLDQPALCLGAAGDIRPGYSRLQACSSATTCCWGAGRELADAERLATLCATFEALIGALDLDQSIQPCRAAPLRLFQQSPTDCPGNSP
jgi:hypothetical protein